MSYFVSTNPKDIQFNLIENREKSEIFDRSSFMEDHSNHTLTDTIKKRFFCRFIKSLFERNDYFHHPQIMFSTYVYKIVKMPVRILHSPK